MMLAGLKPMQACLTISRLDSCTHTSLTRARTKNNRADFYKRATLNKACSEATKNLGETAFKHALKAIQQQPSPAPFPGL
eukprot:1142382-Pelagomonas_calceolata.AAC.11